MEQSLLLDMDKTMNDLNGIVDRLQQVNLVPEESAPLEAANGSQGSSVHPDQQSVYNATFMLKKSNTTYSVTDLTDPPNADFALDSAAFPESNFPTNVSTVSLDECHHHIFSRNAHQQESLSGFDTKTSAQMQQSAPSNATVVHHQLTARDLNLTFPRPVPPKLSALHDAPSKGPANVPMETGRAPPASNLVKDLGNGHLPTFEVLKKNLDTVMDQNGKVTHRPERAAESPEEQEAPVAIITYEKEGNGITVTKKRSVKMLEGQTKGKAVEIDKCTYTVTGPESSTDNLTIDHSQVLSFDIPKELTASSEKTSVSKHLNDDEKMLVMREELKYLLDPKQWTLDDAPEYNPTLMGAASATIEKRDYVVPEYSADERDAMMWLQSRRDEFGRFERVLRDMD